MSVVLTGELNRVAGTEGLAAEAAANVWAGTQGLALLAALNAKNGSVGLGFNLVCNEIAGTQNLDGLAALRTIASAEPGVEYPTPNDFGADDSGAELTVGGVTAINGTLERVETPTRTGLGAFHFVSDGSDSWSVVWPVKTGVTDWAEIISTAWVRLTNDDAIINPVTLMVELFDDADVSLNQWTLDTTPLVTDEWVQVPGGVWNADIGATKYQVSIFGGDIGTNVEIFIDDMQSRVTAVVGEPDYPTPNELDMDPSGAEFYSDGPPDVNLERTRVTSPKRTGFAAFKYTAEANAQWELVKSNNAQGDEYDTVSLSGWFLVPEPINIRGVARPYDDNDYLPNVTDDYVTVPADVWTEVTAELVLPAGALSAELFFEPQTPWTSATDFYADDFVVNTVTGEAPVAPDVKPAVFGTVSEVAFNNIANPSVSHTVPAGHNNRMLLCAVQHSGTPGTHTVNGVTFNGQAFTKGAEIMGGGATPRAVRLWYLLNPPETTASLAVTMSNGSSVNGVVHGINLEHVDQTTPLGTPGYNTTTGATSLTATCDAEKTTDMIFSAIASRQSYPTETNGMSYINDLNASSGSTYGVVSQKTAAVGTNTAGYSFATAFAAMVAVAIHGAP